MMVGVGEFLAQRGLRQTAEPVLPAALQALNDSGTAPGLIEKARSRLDPFQRRQAPSDVGSER
jgi:hypothetical protein